MIKKLTILFLFIGTMLVGVYAQKKNQTGGDPLSLKERQAFDKAFFAAKREKLIDNFDEAIKKYKKCLDIDSKNAAVHYELGSIYMKKNSFVQALEYSKRAHELAPDNLWIADQLAQAYTANRQYIEAAKTFEGIYKRDNKKMLYYFDAANMYLRADEYKAALKIYDEIEAEVGISEDLTRQKEAIYLRMNKVNKAIAEVEKLIAAFPNEPQYLGMLADLYSANDMSDKAYALYQDVLKKDPSNGFAHFALSDIEKERGNADQAFFHQTKGFESDEIDIKTKLNILVSYFVLAGDEPEAKAKAYDLANILIANHPDEAVAFVAYGDLLNNDRKFKEAREQYLKALELESGNFNIWIQLLLCDSELRDDKGLSEHAAEALELFPNQPVLYFYFAAASYQLGNYQAAADKAWEGASLGIAERDLQIQLLATAGDAYHYAKDYNASEKAYEKALKLDDRNAYVLNNYSYFLSLRGEQLEKAEVMSRRSLELEPNNASYQDTYGWVLYKLNRFEEARQWIEKSLQRSPNSAEVLEHYGDILFKLGEVEKAVEQWNKADRAGANSETLSKKIRDRELYE